MNPVAVVPDIARLGLGQQQAVHISEEERGIAGQADLIHGQAQIDIGIAHIRRLDDHPLQDHFPLDLVVPGDEAWIVEIRLNCPKTAGAEKKEENKRAIKAGEKVKGRREMPGGRALARQRQRIASRMQPVNAAPARSSQVTVGRLIASASRIPARKARASQKRGIRKGDKGSVKRDRG